MQNRISARALGQLQVQPGAGEAQELHLLFLWDRAEQNQLKLNRAFQDVEQKASHSKIQIHKCSCQCKFTFEPI